MKPIICYKNVTEKKELTYKELNPKAGEYFNFITSAGRRELHQQTDQSDGLRWRCVEVRTGHMTKFAPEANVERVVGVNIEVLYEN